MNSKGIWVGIIFISLFFGIIFFLYREKLQPQELLKNNLISTENDLPDDETAY